MKEQFVTYEIALKLKELGFDEPCFGRYYEDNSDIGYQLVIDHVNQHIGSNVCHSPLWQQAFDWLENKGMYIHIFYKEEINRYNVSICELLDGDHWGEERKIHHIYDKSQAREQAMLKALELLKNL